MPGGDGTGPLGRGAMTGRGVGCCSGYSVGYGVGRRLGRGYRRGSRRYAQPDKYRIDRNVLEEQQKMLESRLNFVKKELEDLPQEKE